MYYNANERERRYAEQLRLAEPNPEFLARCLRGRSLVGVSVPFRARGTEPHPATSFDAAPCANGWESQPHVKP